MLGSRAGIAMLFFWLGLAALSLIGETPKSWLRRETLRSGQQRLPAIGGAPKPPAAAELKPPRQPQPARPGRARPEGPKAETPLEDPHASLAHWANALAEARRTKGRVRVLHLGDSQIDLDHLSASLRGHFQRRFGDGGIGYVPLVAPWRWFYLPDVAHKSSAGWRLHSVADRRRPDRWLGLGMLAAESEAPSAWTELRFRSGEAGSTITINFLRQPGGGAFTALLDGRGKGAVRTWDRSHQLGQHRILTGPGAHRLRLRTQGRVRLFGAAIESRGEGLSWENLPLISGRFHRLAQADLELWAAQLAARRPALLVLQFGANDTLSFGRSIGSYREQVAKFLRQAREAAPKTACVVVGPLDQLTRDDAGRLGPRPSWAAVQRAQRETALDAGCAFWDARAAMGGEGSLLRWRQRKLIRADLVHLNGRGARLLAASFTRALEAALWAHRRPGGNDALF